MLAGLLAGCIHPGLPGHPHRGPLPAPDSELMARAERIADTVEVLAGEIGPRSFESQPDALDLAEAYLTRRLTEQGYAVDAQPVIGSDNHVTGVPAVMLTDTAIFRNPHYHEPTDTPGAIDPVALGRIARGLEWVLRDLTQSNP